MSFEDWIGAEVPKQGKRPRTLTIAFLAPDGRSRMRLGSGSVSALDADRCVGNALQAPEKVSPILVGKRSEHKFLQLGAISLSKTRSMPLGRHPGECMHSVN
jgi:hypothetical protein